MSDPTPTLVEFLEARITEDEERARDFEIDQARAEVGQYGQGGLETAAARWFGAKAIGFLPGRVLAECTAKRQLIEKLQAERHAVAEDCWYTCPAATEDVDGGECCNDAAGSECNCGRDTRVNGYLALVAVPFADHPDFPGGVR